MLTPGRPKTSLLHRIADGNRLMHCWTQVLRGDAADGHVSRGTRRFQRNALENLERLRRDLLTGEWIPGPVNRYAAQVGDKRRILSVATAADRVVERSVTEVLSEVLDPSFSPFSFGYRKGMGISDALSALRELLESGWTHVLRTDISNAFDELPRQPVIDALEAAVDDAGAVAIVSKLLQRIDVSGLLGTGIPQGSSLSPLLLNVYLTDVDLAMLDLGRVPIRYADDFAIPVADAQDGQEALDTLSDLLDARGLRLNPVKTDIVHASSGFDFLGQSVAPLGRPDASDQHAHPRRASVYVTGQGATVRISKGAVRVERAATTEAAVHVSRVRQIVVSNNNRLTLPLITACAQHDIDIVITSGSGGYVGRIWRRRGGDVRVRMAQYRQAADPSARLSIAREIVTGKLLNQRTHVLRSIRRSGAGAEPERLGQQTASWLHSSIGRVQNARSVQHLLGIEGYATRKYFQWMAAQLSSDWDFNGRNRRPPRDPINAMLSFGYTLLSNEMITACEIAWLDPDLGYLHHPRWGRPSLGLDLMEAWRPVIVDLTVLSVVRSGRISSTDFSTNEADGCRMSDKARRAFIAAYEKRMLTLASSPHVKGRRSYRELLGHHARAFAQDLLHDETSALRGYLWR